MRIIWQKDLSFKTVSDPARDTHRCHGQPQHDRRFTGQEMNAQETLGRLVSLRQTA